MEVTEVLKILSTLSDTDLSKVKDYLNSLITDTNSFRSFFSQKKFENGVFCPHCNSINVKKNGHKGIIQRFLCKDCGKSFTSRNNTITFSSKKSYPIWKKYIECMMNCERIFNEAKRLENISKTIKARFTETLVDAKIEDLDNFLNEHPLEKQILNTSAKDLENTNYKYLANSLFRKNNPNKTLYGLIQDSINADSKMIIPYFSVDSGKNLKHLQNSMVAP